MVKNINRNIKTKSVLTESIQTLPSSSNDSKQESNLLNENNIIDLD